MEKDTLIIGRKPVLDALKGDTTIEKIWIDNSLRGDIEKEIRFLSKKHNIPLQYVPKQKLSSLTPKANHQGLVAQLSLVKYWSIEDIIPQLYEQGRTPAILVLDGIEDVRNIGALARTAVWFDMDAIVISLKKSAMINSFAYKSSAGAIKDIPICREPSLISAISFMKSSGLNIITADLGEDTSNNINFEEPIALVLGSEGKGPSKEIIKLSDAISCIQGSGRVESLNVSVAGAILMHQFYNKRKKLYK
ncbi:MAG: 23S rRNA (guanosine(2251)-2'-O)-methyltransferase RlmB [Saprospiraceae bacterium]|nr:23S rRNA (guanosine(2251)-2'-O)-methyltransferase RlmB [Bacteroidia bacterium]NNE13929.1 23S rRNA (guanosine(2251)-2'-O)-methyltransferase RlmB [Saprospiraceae bacterium]NNL91367.1 23S rRNA (guanosine(2251)-2'-O)-methyltransferase RlmB [Saprospiraceae bacterium]